MKPSQLVETYKFWDVAALWALERLEHEIVIARAMARGVIADGLRFQSIDPRWLKSNDSLNGRPFVGYASDARKPPVVLRREALEHLFAVVQRAAIPSREILSDEFVSREDFRRWVVTTEQALPTFWFAARERTEVDS
jgi:hypothetical protein